jgi:hypothetical protein
MRTWLVASFLLLSFTYQPEGKSVIEFNAGFNYKERLQGFREVAEC